MDKGLVDKGLVGLLDEMRREDDECSSEGTIQVPVKWLRLVASDHPLRAMADELAPFLEKLEALEQEWMTEAERLHADPHADLQREDDLRECAGQLRAILHGTGQQEGGA